MWSLGCLTTALLSGTSYFVNSQDSNYRDDSSAAVAKASEQCDLTGIDNSPAWETVSTQAKDFIKKLLTLDEKARMNADQALEHDWFTQGSRRETIQTAYDKAIHGWTITNPAWDFIEDLSSLMKARKTYPQKVFSLTHSLIPLTP